MSNDPTVLVVIPTYLEADNIEEVLKQARRALPSGHVLVVDDNSSDGTAYMAEECGKQLGNIDVIRRPGKSGLGTAYKEGFEWGLAKGFEILIEMDADLSHDPSDLPRLVSGITEGADLVIGSRYITGGAVPGWPLHRALLSRVGNMYATGVLGLKIADATSGYRSYRATTLKTLDLVAIRADGYGFQIEMAYRMRLAGARLSEIPITFVDRVEGQSKMSTKIIVEALRLVTVWGFRDRIKRRRVERR